MIGILKYHDYGVSFHLCEILLFAASFFEAAKTRKENSTLQRLRAIQFVA